MKYNDTQSTPECNPGRSQLRSRLPKILFATVTLATLLAAVAIVAQRRNPPAPVKHPDALRGTPERAAAEQFIPPAVPDEANIVATPFFVAALARQDEALAWAKDFSQVDQWPRQFPLLRDSAVGRQTGRTVWDLVSWQKAFEQAKGAGTNQDEIVVSAAPDPAANAQAAIAVLKALEPYEPVLNELRATSRRSRARFDIRYDLDNPWATLLPHLAVVKRTCQVLRLRACAALDAGRAEEGLQDSLLLLRLTDAPAQEPMLISQLVRVACLQIALQPIWEGLADRRWSADQLQALQKQMQQFDFVADLRRTMEAERAWGNLTIAIVRERRTPDLLLSMLGPGEKAAPWKKEADQAFQTCPREWFDQEQHNYNQMFDERLLSDFDVKTRRFKPAVAEANSRFVTQATRDKTRLLEDHLIFANELLVAPAKTQLRMANAQSCADFVILACALDRYRLAHGQYPDRLTALRPQYLEHVPHDLIDGQPLRYQRTTDGSFLLYSIGWNEVDEQGEPAFPASGRGTEIKDGDWVWRYPTRK